ncbi:MAG TPA: LamG-like jellyroll fold domain-containing protein, partial [Lacunisphaera sp.]|nr:LamG-like jellyroll fold domain-containing protein [Lacunisphaera sp.]
GNSATVLSVPANALSLNPNGNGLAYFTNGTPWTLAIGESLQATFTLTLEGSSLPAGNDLLRVSLLNSHGTSTDRNATTTANRVAADSYSSSTLAFRNNSGYMAGAAFVPTTASGLRFFSRNYEANNTISGTASHTTMGALSGTGGFGFAPNAPYAATFTVRRATATTTVLTLAFQGTFANGTTGTWSHTLTDNTGQPTYTFDMLVFFVGTGGGLTAARLDNIRVGSGVPATTPAITLQPQGRTAGLGANIILTAAAEGDPAPTLQWRKNGVDIPGATGITLELTNIAAGDAGDYTFVATNAAGAVSSEIAVVTVYDPSAPALQFGGIDLVAANQNMRGLNAGAVAFSAQTPVSPLSGYTGPLFHGAAFVKNGALIDQWNVFNDNVNGDSLRFRMSAPPLNATSVGIFLWKRDVFNSPYRTGTAVNLATQDAVLSYSGRRFGTAVGSESRFIVQTSNGSYFISAAVTGGIPAGFDTVTLTNPAATQWFSYDPSTDTIGATPQTPNLTSILAAGARLQVVKTGSDAGAITAALSAFRVVSGSSIPAVTGSLNVFGVVGRALSYAVPASNSPTNYAFGSLPAGFSADASTGVISGMPTATGLFPITVRPSNASGVGPMVTLTLSIAPAAEGVIPTAGLISNFEFNGNANDLVANRGGTVYGATLGQDRFGRANNAYVFDGLTQYLEIPDADDFSASTTGELTITVWMRPDALVFPVQQGSGYVHWMGKGGAGQHEWTFRMYGTGNSENRENRTSFYLFNAGGLEGAGSYVQEPVTVGGWNHYVAVVNVAADTITWYKNGVQKDQDPFFNSIYNVTPVNGTAPLRLGTRDFLSYFKGAIDDLRIYNRVLTLAEIQELYGDSLGMNRAPVALGLSNQTLTLATAGAGAVVGTLTPTDPDAGDGHVYSLPGVGGDAFALSGATLVVGGAGLSAGSHEVLVRTTDQGGLFFERQFTITVAQAIPAVAWIEPAAITYGTPLSSTQLNASATGLNGAILTGVFAYSPGPDALLNAGADQPLEVVFTPTGADAANYTSAVGTVSITVNQAAPSIAWPVPAPIQYGTPLSSVQLNAEA